MRARVLWLAVAGLGGCRGATSGEPYVPARDDVVLESASRVPNAAVSPNADLPSATASAKQLIAESRKTGDPRLLGRAQATLAPWWELATPPDDVLFLRATIRQNRHEFVTALADLDQLLAHQPNEAQARLTRAVVRAVLAMYPEALADCDALAGRSAPVIVAVCRAGIWSVTGKTSAALASLQPFLTTTNEWQAWALSVYGEAASYVGQNDVAERSWRTAIALDPTDDYSRAALADLYLDTQRFADARTLVGDRLDNDGMLLRVVLAEAGGRLPNAADHAVRLRERYAASRARGDTVHGREQARFALIDHDPALALELARANWATQHEPWDARVLLEAALAAGQPSAAAPALAWLAQTGFEHPLHRKLAAQVNLAPR